MACFPGSGTDTSPLLQVQKVGSNKAPGLLPTIYSPLSGMESSSLCIPSSHTGSSHDYSPVAFYNHSTLGYSRPTISDNPSLCPPLFWPPHDHGQHNMPPLTHHCPQPLLFSNPNQHAPFEEPKPLNLTTSSPPLHPTKLPRKNFCAVCNHYASGYHYSVQCCEGCKAFFKRSIKGHKDYICPGTNQCTINKNLRKMCRSCRLRKCYEVGMKKCGMRPEHYSFMGARHRRVPQGRGAPGRLVGVGARAQWNLEGGSLSLLEVHHSSLTPEQLISCIMHAEPPEIYLMEDLKRPFTEARMMMSLTKLANKELFFMISWAKKIPGFVELSLTYQMHQLESCWLDVLMLGLMWRSIDHPGKLIFSADLKLNREEGNCVKGIVIIFDKLLAATTRFRELNLQREEYVCLKAMILLNSNICSTSPEMAEDLESRGKLQLLLDSVTDALVWAISKQGLSFQLQSARLAHLLMLLSDIRHVSGKGMKHLSDMKNNNIVQVSDLLLEMLTNGSRMSAPHDPSNHDLTVLPAAQAPATTQVPASAVDPQFQPHSLQPPSQTLESSTSS
ncbi:estrogen receptor beta-like [Salvelinus namaycush]|uniref:Estrogen receptor beta-like n=1 Tax=Salvelinus namaycush TaxID=8040 RepID=A0A8U0PG75_SALNM|nr:estrogen receptor beta-like [Salvelinus namaycush]